VKNFNEPIIRRAAEADLPAITELFAGTVRNINSKNYTEKEIRIWASGADNLNMWKKRIERQYFVVSEVYGIITGFSSIEPDGYLDFLYVHKDYQRHGFAKALLEEIERKAIEQKNTLVFIHVSKTARGFFEKHGYKYEGDEVSPGFEYVNGKTIPVDDVTFINSKMVKLL